MSELYIVNFNHCGVHWFDVGTHDELIKRIHECVLHRCPVCFNKVEYKMEIYNN